MADNFEDFKVGDLLILHTNNGSRVVKVGRLTSKQLVTEKPEHKFWKKNGSEVGGSVWSHNHIAKGTAEEFTAINDRNRRLNKAYKVRNLYNAANISTLSEDDLDTMLDILITHSVLDGEEG